MPVTRRDRTYRNGLPDLNSFGHVDTTSFLFDDDKQSDQNTPVAKQFPTSWHVQTTQDNFPTLRPAERAADPVAASSFLDLGEEQDGGWPNFSSNNNKRQSVPPLSTYHVSADSTSSALPPPSLSGSNTPSKSNSINRHSMGARIGMPPTSETKRPGLVASPPSASSVKSGSSFSTSSVPTIGSIGKSNNIASKNGVNSSAEQRLHQHNMSLGRIPASAANSNRQSRDYSSSTIAKAEDSSQPPMPSLASTLQNSATAFGTTGEELGSPTLTQASNFPNGAHVYNGTLQSPQGGHNMPNLQALSAAMNSIQLQQAQSPYSGMQGMSYGGYNPFNAMPPTRLPDNQARVSQQRRIQGGDGTSSFLQVADPCSVLANPRQTRHATIQLS